MNSFELEQRLEIAAPRRDRQQLLLRVVFLPRQGRRPAIMPVGLSVSAVGLLVIAVGVLGQSRFPAVSRPFLPLPLPPAFAALPLLVFLHRLGRGSAERRCGPRRQARRGRRSDRMRLLNAIARSNRPRRATRCASSSPCCCMKSLFMKNRRCSGTVVEKRCSADRFGLGKSNSCRVVVEACSG